MQETVIALPYGGPLDWQSLLQFFRGHQLLTTETITESSYGRVFRLGGETGYFQVAHHAQEPQLVLQVHIANPQLVPDVVQKVRGMFDLDTDIAAVQKTFAGTYFFAALWRDYPGLRLASGWDAFETAINTILGQLVSVSRAKALMRQLVELHGERLTHPLTGAEAWLFPGPQVLAEADLTGLGTTGMRKKTIREFSRRVAAGELDLALANRALLRKQLLTVPGIGPWSVEYIALRALGDKDAFPGTDLVLKRALEKYPDIQLDQVKPWRSYAAVYLWKHYLAAMAAEKAAQ